MNDHRTVFLYILLYNTLERDVLSLPEHEHNSRTFSTLSRHPSRAGLNFRARAQACKKNDEEENVVSLSLLFYTRRTRADDYCSRGRLVSTGFFARSRCLLAWERERRRVSMSGEDFPDWERALSGEHACADERYSWRRFLFFLWCVRWDVRWVWGRELWIVGGLSMARRRNSWLGCGR